MNEFKNWNYNGITFCNLFHVKSIFIHWYGIALGIFDALIGTYGGEQKRKNFNKIDNKNWLNHQQQTVSFYKDNMFVICNNLFKLLSDKFQCGRVQIHYFPLLFLFQFNEKNYTESIEIELLTKSLSMQFI